MDNVNLMEIITFVSITCSIAALAIVFLSLKKQSLQFIEIHRKIVDLQAQIKQQTKDLGRTDREILHRENEILRQEQIIRSNVEATRREPK